jgi:hypothetical protein
MSRHKPQDLKEYDTKNVGLSHNFTKHILQNFEGMEL